MIPHVTRGDRVTVIFDREPVELATGATVHQIRGATDRLYRVDVTLADGNTFRHVCPSCVSPEGHPRTMDYWRDTARALIHGGLTPQAVEKLTDTNLWHSDFAEAALVLLVREPLGRRYFQAFAEMRCCGLSPLGILNFGA